VRACSYVPRRDARPSRELGLPGAFSRFRAKPHDRWATDSTWDRLLGELSADADAAGELYWLVGVDSSISRGVTTQAPAQACPAHSPQDRTRLPPASTRSRELVQLCVKAA
jgi:hypothetical protein